MVLMVREEGGLSPAEVECFRVPSTSPGQPILPCFNHVKDGLGWGWGRGYLCLLDETHTPLDLRWNSCLLQTCPLLDFSIK